MVKCMMGPLKDLHYKIMIRSQLLSLMVPVHEQIFSQGAPPVSCCWFYWASAVKCPSRVHIACLFFLIPFPLGLELQ